MPKPSLILASKSPRRKQLLRQLGLSFRVIPSHIPEHLRRSDSPSKNARRIALEKAQDVAKRVKHGIVIGADTIVVLDHHVLGKPRSEKDAKRMLRLLSGRSHTVYTGFALIDARTGRTRTAVESTRVRFRMLSSSEIDRYIASGSPLDKAGAYGIQDDFGAVFVQRISGCFNNVVGFPLARFYREWQALLMQLQAQE